MAEREAQVVEIITIPGQDQPGLVRLAFDASSGCGRCHETGGCGGISLTQPVCGKPKTLLVPDRLGLQINERVLVSVPDAMLSRGATRAYLIPLLLLFAGSLLGGALLPLVAPLRWQLTPDVGAIAGAGVGLVLAWWQLQRGQQDGQIPVPRIVHRLN